MKKEKVWIPILAGYALKGVTVRKNWFLGYYCVYRDLNRKCYRGWFYKHELVPRF